MRKFYFRGIGLLLCFLMLGYSWSYGGTRGQAGQAAAYLKMGVGARAFGMGNAFVAIADDATCNFYNPAGLPYHKTRQVTTMHAMLDLDRSLNYVGYVHPIAKGKVFGLHGLKFGIDDIEARAGNNDSGYLPGDLMGIFENEEYMVGGTYGFKVKENFYMGVGIKYLYQKLYLDKADAYAMDVGTIFKLTDNFKIGAVLREISSSLEWEKSKHKDKIPYTAIFGVAYEPRKNITFSVDLNKLEDIEPTWHVGLEGWFYKTTGLRIGFDDGDFTAGASYKASGWQIDYGYKQDETGDIHRISGTLFFSD